MASSTPRAPHLPLTSLAAPSLCLLLVLFHLLTPNTEVAQSSVLGLLSSVSLRAH